MSGRDDLRAALVRAVEAGWTEDSIDLDLYHNDAVYHAVVYTVRRALDAVPVQPKTRTCPDCGLTREQLGDIHINAQEAAAAAPPSHPDGGIDVADRRLIGAALRYYADTMPGYAAAAGLSPDDFAAVMVDVHRARRLAAAYDQESGQ